MRVNNLKLGLLAVAGFTVTVSYQNCAPIRFSGKSSAQADSTRAILQDENGNIDNIISMQLPVTESSNPVVENAPKRATCENKHKHREVAAQHDDHDDEDKDEKETVRTIAETVIDDHEQEMKYTAKEIMEVKEREFKDPVTKEVA